MSASLLTRAVLVLAALAACAWLLAQYHDAQLTESVKRINNDPYSTPREIRGAIADAGRVGTLDPDTYEARVYRALLEERAGDHAGAVRELQAVVRDQPNYLEAWRLLSLITVKDDPALSAQAADRVRELDPVFAKRLLH